MYTSRYVNFIFTIHVQNLPTYFQHHLLQLALPRSTNKTCFHIPSFFAELNGRFMSNMSEARSQATIGCRHKVSHGPSLRGTFTHLRLRFSFYFSSRIRGKTRQQDLQVSMFCFRYYHKIDIHKNQIINNN